DAQTYACFASFCEQRYPCFEILFGVMEPADPAVEVVRRLKRAYPAVSIQLVISDRRIGANLKVCNLQNMLDRAAHDLLLISDADIRVGPEALAQIVASCSEPGVGLATCPYCGVDIRSAPAALEALGIATDFLPGAFLVAQLARADFAFGAAIALRRQTLRAIGGFAAIADYLADDYQRGIRVAATGAAVIVCPEVIESVIGSLDWRSMLAHRVRWARTVRVCRPAGHAASVITQSTIFA